MTPKMKNSSSIESEPEKAIQHAKPLSLIYANQDRQTIPGFSFKKVSD
jgi:hypothetical protein